MSAASVYLDHNATSPLRPAAFDAILASRDRARGGPSAPANGLCLIAVEYGDARRSKNDDDEADE